MSDKSMPVLLTKVATNRQVKGWLQPVMRRVIVNTQTIFSAEKATFRAAQRKNRQRVAPAEHSHWDWVWKFDNFAGRDGEEFWGIKYANRMQGLMHVTTIDCDARLIGQRGKQLVYIHFLEVAPRNLNMYTTRPLYYGVGTALLMAATSVSLDCGYEGRIGLHSLPQAEDFYVRSGMSDLGMDRTAGLRYYEMSDAQARAFRSR